MPRGKGITGDVQEAVSHQPCNGSKANSKQSAVHRSTVRRLLTRQKRSIAVFQKTARKKKIERDFLLAFQMLKFMMVQLEKTVQIWLVWKGSLEKVPSF